MAHAYIDLGGAISKFYSFFDPRVFQAFQRYVNQLAKYLIFKNKAISIAGLSGGAIERVNGREFFVNYLEDSSRTFDQGFSRFISKVGLSNEMNFNEIGEEREAKYLYFQMIQDLYLQTAREALDEHWVGHLDFSFLGGGPNDIFRRMSSSGENITEYVEELPLSLAHNKIPSITLLSGPSNPPGLTKFLSRVVTPNLIKLYLNQEIDDDGQGIQYRPLSFFEIYEHSSRYAHKAKSWHDIGLKQYLDEVYPGMYKINDHLNRFQTMAYPLQWVHCIFGSEVDESTLNGVLRAFFNGASFIIDSSGMDLKTTRKLESLVLENSLTVEEIKYKITVRRIVLGTGQIILFDGKNLEQHRDSVKNIFWQKMLSIFKIRRQEFKLDDGIIAIWKKDYPSRKSLILKRSDG